MQLQCPPPTDVVRWIALWWFRQCSCPPTPASAVPSNCTFCTAPICKQDLSICLWRSSCKWAGFFYVCIVLNFSFIFKWVFVLFFFNIYSFFSVYKVLLCTMYTVNSSTEFQSAPVFHFFYKALPYSLQVNQHIWNFSGISKPVYHKKQEMLKRANLMTLFMIFVDFFCNIWSCGFQIFFSLYWILVK